MLKDKILSTLISLAIIAVAVCALSTRISTTIGEQAGTVVGTAIGSYNGITEGLAQGLEDGTEDGLSATDITIDIEPEITQVGNLEVLVAGITITDTLSIGDAYKELYALQADAVFSVDLTQTKVSYSVDGDVYISIPEPEVELYLNLSTSEKLAEVSNFSFTVSAQDGMTAYLNSMANLQSSAADSIDGYDSLMNEARSAAIAQVQQLAKAICGSQKTVYVQFQ